MNIVNLMIKKGANQAKLKNKNLNHFFHWSGGMQGAAIGGHMDIVKFFIEKGAYDWNSGMDRAAKGGHIDIVQFFIEKGADVWSWSMRGAARGGHMDIVQLMIEKGANDWYNGMEWAAWGGHMDIVKLLINKLFNECLFNDKVPKQSKHYTPEDYTKFHNQYYYQNIQLFKEFLVDDIVDYILYDYLKI